MKHTYPVLILIFLLFLFGCKKKNEKKHIEIYSWNILTDHTPTALKTLEATTDYDVNQIQLSEEICRELRDVKHQWNRNIVNNLTERAHEIGIPEVLVWDKALYPLKYYPDRFKINGKINLDNRSFWEWLIRDYKNMLEKIPEVDGIVLTLNNTAIRIEEQHSEVINSPEQKLATFVDSLANFIVNQKKLELYLRYPVHSQKDVETLISFLETIKTPDLKFMVNGFQVNVLSSQQYSEWVERIPMQVIMDFDCAHVNEGQTNVASIFPDLHLKLWKHYQKIPNVKGFSLRTDRLGKTSVIDRPSEINLFAIYEATKMPEIETDTVILNYLYNNYDSLAVPYFFDAFKLAPKIILASFYTMGINTTDHSQLDFNYRPSFSDNLIADESRDPEITIGHNVDKSFRYWGDIVNHLAPGEFKTKEAGRGNMNENNWLQPEELMDTTYLNYILTEKRFAINEAMEAISKINTAKIYCSNARAFNRVYHTFNRTMLTAKLRKAYAQVYYANRIWNRGEEFQNDKLLSLINDGIIEIQNTSEDIKSYRRKGPKGQYNWVEDAEIAIKLVQEIKNSDIWSQIIENNES